MELKGVGESPIKGQRDPKADQPWWRSPSRQRLTRGGARLGLHPAPAVERSVGEGRWSGRRPEVRGVGEEAVGCRRGSCRESERRTEKKEANRYLHNQWQVGNFYAKKPIKSGKDGAFVFLLGKISCGFWALWLAFDFCKSKSRLNSPTKDTLILALVPGLVHTGIF